MGRMPCDLQTLSPCQAAATRSLERGRGAMCAHWTETQGQPPAPHASLCLHFLHPSFHPPFPNMLTDPHRAPTHARCWERREKGLRKWHMWEPEQRRREGWREEPECPAPSEPPPPTCETDRARHWWEALRSRVEP